MACCKESGGTEGWTVLAKGRVAHVRTAQCGTKRNPGRIVDTCSYHTGEGKRSAEQDRGRGRKECLVWVVSLCHMFICWKLGLKSINAQRWGLWEKLLHQKGSDLTSGLILASWDVGCEFRSLGMWILKWYFDIRAWSLSWTSSHLSLPLPFPRPLLLLCISSFFPGHPEVSVFAPPHTFCHDVCLTSDTKQWSQRTMY